ncbi:MAG: SLC13 family permease, partial [Pseudomonadota bacterium]
MELAAAAPWQMWATLAIIAAAIVFYMLDRVSLELVSAGVIVALLLFFHIAPLVDASGALMLPPERLLSGFASPALFSIIGLLIIGLKHALSD